MADVPPDMAESAPGQPCGPQLLSEEPAPTVAFRVKRWANRSSRVEPFPAVPAHQFVPPTCKGKPSEPPPQLSPRGFQSPSGMGLAPPVLMRGTPTFPPLPVGGLTYTRPQLGIWAPGLNPLVAVPVRPQVPASQPFRPPMMAEMAQAGWSEPLSGVTPSGRSAFSMLAMHDHLKAQHLKSWLHLLHTAGRHSDLFAVTEDSELASDHRVKAISRYAPLTLSAYLRMWQQWQAFAQCHGASPYSPPAMLVADFLHVHSKASNQGLAINYLKALSWVSKHAGFPDLSATLQLPLTKAYGVASNPSPRREAPPLPLSFVVWMENTILSGSGTVADRLILGGLLLMVWGSLRWSDCQWIAPSSLIIDAEALRGLATRTKSTARGMPFGILCSGFMGHTSHVSWVSVWMNLVREAIHRTSLSHAGFVPDFIIPQVGADLDAPQFLSPMTRSQGVLLLRKFMLTADPSVAVDLIGVHSCKVTFLSWSRQLGLDEDLRRHQGHHRAPGSGWCVDLYSRDDVHPALQLQKILRSKVGAGFRPVMPVLRGAGPSVSDKPVIIPPLPASSVVDCETSIHLPQAEDDVDTDSEASDDDDVAPVPSGTTDPGTRPMAEGVSDCVFLLNNVSNVVHFACECDSTDPHCVCTFAWQGVIRSCKFACGARWAVGDNSITPSESIPPTYRICLRAACSKAFD
eukprot:s4770_g3.t1